LPYPVGRQDDIRAFYGELLGLKEKPVPVTIAHLDLVWFEAGADELELHFLPDRVAPDRRTRRHFCLEVDELDGLRSRLEHAGVETTEQEPIPNRPRFFSRDPFGNLIEFTTIMGDYRGGT
jgi:catechol 2,3-dioxygenase-like lactoylglutathione lyase family enzyme